MAMVTLNCHPPSTKNHVWPWQHLSWLETHSALAGEAVQTLEKEVRTGDSADCVIAVMCTHCTIAKFLLEFNSNSTAWCLLLISQYHWCGSQPLPYPPTNDRWPSYPSKSKQTWTRWPFTEIVGAYISNLPITIYSNPSNTYMQTKYLNRYM